MEYAVAVWDPLRTREINERKKVQRMAAGRVTGRMRRIKTFHLKKTQKKEKLWKDRR